MPAQASKTSKYIKISVASHPIPNRSHPGAHKYAFSYTIKVKNTGAGAVQLLEQHWLLKQGGRPVAEIVGPFEAGGVSPILEKGQAIEMESGAVIDEPIGTLQGSLTFRRDDGKFIQAAVPIVDLHFPVVVH